MRLKVFCAMCGKGTDIEIPTNSENPWEIALSGLGNIIQRAHWIVQINGKNMDIYCSKRCAK